MGCLCCSGCCNPQRPRTASASSSFVIFEGPGVTPIRGSVSSSVTFRAMFFNPPLICPYDFSSLSPTDSLAMATSSGTASVRQVPGKFGAHSLYREVDRSPTTVSNKGCQFAASRPDPGVGVAAGVADAGGGVSDGSAVGVGAVTEGEWATLGEVVG